MNKVQEERIAEAGKSARDAALKLQDLLLEKISGLPKHDPLENFDLDKQIRDAGNEMDNGAFIDTMNERIQHNKDVIERLRRLKGPTTQPC